MISLTSRHVWNWSSKFTTHSLVFCEIQMSKKLQCEIAKQQTKATMQRLSLEQNYLLLPSSYVVSSTGNFTHTHGLFTVITHQKKSFGQNFFSISCKGSKVPFLLYWKIDKMALLNPSMKFKKYFDQKTSFEALWKGRILKISIKCPRVHQIQGLGQSNWGFSHKGLTTF